MKLRDGSLFDFGRAFVVVLLVLTALPGCGSSGSSSGSGSPQATLQSVEVTPTTSSLAAGTSAQLTATAIWSNNQHTDVTSQATWTSSGPNVSVSSAGKVQASTVGSATVTALYQGQSGTATVAVTAAVLESIALTPPGATLALGTSEQLTATGTFSDGTTQNMSADVTWTSSSPSVSSVSASGLVQSVALGSSTITATCSNASVCGTISGSTGVTVTAAVLQSIQVTPATATVPRGLAQQFTATGVYSDGTHQDLTSSSTWAPDNSNVVTFTNTAGSFGHAVSANVGTANITATSAGVVSTKVPFTVTAATLVSIAITPPAPSIALGTTQALTATGTYTDNSTQDLTSVVVWSSSTPIVASINNSSPAGVASGLSVGSTTIGAATGAVQASVTLTVTPAVLQSIQVTSAQPSVALGYTDQFTATGTYSDGTHQDLTSAATWASDTPGVATISNAAGSNGLATSAAVGTVNITAAVGSIASGPVSLTVTAATLVSLAITPATPSIAAGTSQQFTATGTYSDNTTQDLTSTVTWTSSAPTIAAMSNVSPYGVAQSLQMGGTTITAASGTVQASATLTVTAAALQSIQVSPNTASVALGLTLNFTATGHFTDGSTQNLTNAVTWASDSSAVVISNALGSQGTATTRAIGGANITAASGAIVSPAVTFTVTAAQLTALSLAPAQDFSMVLGSTRQVTVTGIFTDGTTQDMTTSGSLTWLSDGSTLSISNGIVRAQAAHQTTLGVVDPVLRIYSNAVTVTVTYDEAALFIMNFGTGAVVPIQVDYQGNLLTSGQAFSLPTISNSPSQVMATDPTGHFLYVIAGASIQAYQITGNGVALPGSSVPDAYLPSAIAVDPTGKFVYVTDSATQQLQMYAVKSDGSLSSPGTTVGSTGSDPAGIALTPNGAYAYVTNSTGASVSQFTLGSDGLETATPVQTFPTGVGPAVVVVDPAGKHVYVANYDGEAGSTISQFTIGSSGGLTPMSQPTVSTGWSPVSMAMDPSGSRLYVLTEQDSTVWGYSVGANGALGTAPATHLTTPGSDPASIAIDPYGKYAFVVDDVNNQMTQFSINGDGTLTSLATVSTGATNSEPTAVIATWPRQ